MATTMDKVFVAGHKYIEQVIKAGCTTTEPGSIGHLLWGKQGSKQSICIKMGKYGELIFKEIVKNQSHLELLKCGVQIIDKKSTKKDIDLCWKDDTSKTIYVRECKGNIELDTEKLPATFKKMTEDIQPWIAAQYPDYNIDIGILNWSVYDRDTLTKGISHINKCEQNGVKVDHVKQFVELVKVDWNKKEYERHFQEVGKKLSVLLE